MILLSKECLLSIFKKMYVLFIDTSDNIRLSFFSEIAVNRAQNFEFFELSEDEFDENAFRRKRCIMSFLLRSERNISSSFVRQNGFCMKFLQTLMPRIGEHKGITRHMIRHLLNFEIMIFIITL